MNDQHATNSLQTFLGGDAEVQSADIEDSASEVGTRIAAARTSTGQSQADVANHLGVKVSTIEKWESGASSPRSNRLTALAGILGVSLSWLIVGYGTEPIPADDVTEVRAALSRVRAQLVEALEDVEMLVARLDNTRTG